MPESQRDAFINSTIEKLKINKNAYFLSADFGAPALDTLRDNFKDQFIHCGISEQAMIDMAAGLALDDNIVICYAMAPFISIRALEQIKCGPGLMNLKICIVSVGVGFGYADAGPTHYTTEDFACLRSIPRSSIYTASDSRIASLIATNFFDNPKFKYVRLDRDSLPNLDNENSFNFNDGFRTFGNINNNSIALISHGKMTHLCVEMQKNNPEKFFCIDIIRGKPISNKVAQILDKSKGFITVDEQTLNGSLFSSICELISSEKIYTKGNYIALPDDFEFENGGREYLLKKNGLTSDKILELSKFF